MTDSGEKAPGPLHGYTVVDLSRMLPGAVLARTLIDLGARWIKIEQPGRGDPLRGLPPLVDGVGAGFCAFFRGAESVAVDLGGPSGPTILRELASRADVLVESFRPGKLASWGAGPELLARWNPALVICSLSGFGSRGAEAGRIGHDINFIASSGLLSTFSGGRIPEVQVADVASAMLAASAVLAALLDRQRSGRGAHLEQPLATGPLPFLTLAMADAAADGGAAAGTLLSGACPAYRLYRCGDGRDIAVGALEPKFWEELVEALGMPDLAGAGLDPGAAGQEAARRVEAEIGSRPRDDWLALARERNLPLSPVHDVAAAARGTLRTAGLIEETPAPGGTALATPGPYLSSLGVTPRRPAPRLGEHTARVLREMGIEDP